MTFEIALVFGIILVMVVLFIFELMSVDKVAFMIMVVLMITGLVTPQQGIMGFANQATITIMALMIIGAGLEECGAVTIMAKGLKNILQKRESVSMLAMMGIVSFTSAFIATTAVVIVFIKILMNLFKDDPKRLSKLLMPLSFAGILGGSCSLMGTSTNLLVNSIAVDFGYGGFGIFEFSPIGAVFLVAALIYMILFGRRFIPNRLSGQSGLQKRYALNKYVTQIMVNPESQLIGKPLSETVFHDNNTVDLLEITRSGKTDRIPNKKTQIESGDMLTVRATTERMMDMRNSEGVEFTHDGNALDFLQQEDEDFMLVEAVVLPNSHLLGRTLKKSEVQERYGAIPLAIKRRRTVFKKKETLGRGLDQLRVEPGDTILMELCRDTYDDFRDHTDDFVILQEYDLPNSNKKKAGIAFAILLLVIVLAAFNILPLMISALTGCLLMFLTRILDIQKAYQSVNWSIIFLLAGMIPLGSAMHNTGADQWLAESFVHLLGKQQPWFYIGAIFLFTTLMSSVVSNNATAILVAPIAISIATGLSLDPKAFLLTVMFAANMSFFTPIGYQTNTLVYGAGQYKFKDFVVVGGILTIIVWVLASILIPWVYF